MRNEKLTTAFSIYTSLGSRGVCCECGVPCSVEMEKGTGRVYCHNLNLSNVCPLGEKEIKVS